MTLASVALVLAIIACASVIVALPFVLLWLKRYLKAKSKAAVIDERLRAQQERNWFIDARLIPFASSKAEQWLVTKLPGLVTGDASFAWSNHWKALNDFVKAAAVKKFMAEDVNVIEYLTEPVLIDIVERVVLKMVKCPPPHVANAIPESYQIIFGEGFLGFVSKYGDSLLEA